MRHLLLVGLVAGCAQLRDTASTSSDGATFPHSDDYASPLAHGPDAVAAGSASCQTCHDGSGPPTCDLCHDLYPHATDMVSGSVHGAGILEGTVTVDRCEACHATSGLLALEQAACDSCHGSYPHADGWSAGDQHGAYALARGSAVAACGSCHGTDLSGGSSGVSCSLCHSSWPHADGFTDPAEHGAQAAADPSACSGCHGDDGDAIPTATCSTCHSAYPHGDDFDHVAAATLSGEDACMACHEEGDGPETMPASCGASCHGGDR